MSVDELQKALEAKAEQESQIRIDLGLQKLPFTDKTQISVNGALEVFSAFQKDKMKRLKVAEEKNEEYAKLVAVQAQEYAEKLEGKLVVDRKQLIDLMKQQPFPEAFKWITDFKSQYQHWTKKLKKLLEDKVVFEDPK